MTSLWHWVHWGKEETEVGEVVRDMGDVSNSFFTSVVSVFCLFVHFSSKIASILKLNFLFDNKLLSPMMDVVY